MKLCVRSVMDVFIARDYTGKLTMHVERPEWVEDDNGLEFWASRSGGLVLPRRKFRKIGNGEMSMAVLAERTAQPGEIWIA